MTLVHCERSGGKLPEQHFTLNKKQEDKINMNKINMSTNKINMNTKGLRYYPIRETKFTMGYVKRTINGKPLVSCFAPSCMKENTFFVLQCFCKSVQGVHIVLLLEVCIAEIAKAERCLLDLL